MDSRRRFKVDLARLLGGRARGSPTVRHGGVGLDDGAEVRFCRAPSRGRGWRRRGTCLLSTIVVLSAASTMLKNGLDVGALGRLRAVERDRDLFTMSLAVTTEDQGSVNEDDIDEGVTLIPVIASSLLGCAGPSPLTPHPSMSHLRPAPGSAIRVTRGAAMASSTFAAPSPVARRCARRTCESASVLASGVDDALEPVERGDGGIATRRPTAVATSASAMFAMTASGRPARRP